MPFFNEIPFASWIPNIVSKYYIYYNTYFDSVFWIPEKIIRYPLLWFCKNTSASEFF